MQFEHSERIINLIKNANQYLDNIVRKYEEETGKKAQNYNHYTEDFLEWKAKKEI